MNDSLKLGLVISVPILILTSLLTTQVDAQDAKLRWYKGNLHTHSLWSDGDDFPDMIVKWYVDHDYQFLSLTDHNILSNGDKWMSAKAITKRGGEGVIKKYRVTFGDSVVQIREGEKGSQVKLRTYAQCQAQFDKPESFLLLAGEEISDQVGGLPLHMNATNLQKILRPAGGTSMRRAMRANLRSAQLQATELQREILVHLNHPNFGWAITAEDLAAVTEEKFFEVYNGHPGVNQLGDANRASVEKIWDIVNTIRTDKLDAPPIMGLATDDCHYYHGRKGSQPGRGWVMVRSTALKPDTILKAINAGDFYASSGVQVEDLAFDPESGKLKIDVKPQPGVTYQIEFIGTLRDYDSSSKPRTNDQGQPVPTTRKYSSDIGKILKTTTGNSAEYQLSGDELYVRATITSSQAHPNPSFKKQQQQAWIQPVVWKKNKPNSKSAAKQ